MAQKLILSGPDKHFETLKDFIEEVSNEFDVAENFDSTIDQDTVVVCFGGDGSLNYLVNQLSPQEVAAQPSVIYFPMGTANDFARSLKIRSGQIPTLQKLKSILNSQFLTEIPLMSCNDRFFVNVASVGVPAMITESGEDSFKELSGTLSYYLSAIKQVFSEKLFEVSISQKGQEKLHRKTFGFFVSQGLFAGGGIKVSTSSSPLFGDTFNFLMPQSEEKLDAVLVATEIQKEAPNLTEYDLISEFMEELTVSCDEELPVKLDGEVYSSNLLKFKKSGRSLNFYIH